ncbi:MAG: DUF4932 domain-containing protein [bacterium]|nr:DUF4932 domain-containing protein [bacterium]
MMLKSAFNTSLELLLIASQLCSVSLSYADSQGVSRSTDLSSRLTVTVDPRIELLATVQLLSDYKGFNGNPVLTQFDFPYRDAVASYFEPFNDHPAVKLFSEMSQQGFWYGHPPHAMLHLGPPPDLEEVVAYDPFVLERAGGRHKLELFVNALRDFATESKFMDFFDANAEAYGNMVANYLDQVPRDYIADLENYFGVHQRSYNVVLAPLFHCGGFGPRIDRGEGIFDVYNLGGPCDVVDGHPTFGSEARIRRLFWHEFGHSFVNHLTDQNSQSVATSSKVLLGEKVSNEHAEAQAAEFVSEHILRAITTRLAFLHFGAAAGKTALKEEKTAGFPYVATICVALENYESNRDRYPAMIDFYPQLIQVFEKLAQEHS